ncbi:N-6 DNA methylase [Vibrio parahaemolyticus]
MNKKKHFAQYYTPKVVADILAFRAYTASSLTVESVLELAAGDGQLLASLLSISPSSKATAIDIDPENIDMLKSKRPFLEAIHSDAMTDNIFGDDRCFEMGLANPPFLAGVTIDEYKRKLLIEYLKMECSIGDKVRSEYVFVCQYLRFLKEDGILSIILPATIISGSRCESFRKAILHCYKIVEIYQVVDCGFNDTEAETFVLTLKKTPPNESDISLKKISPKGEVLSDIKIKRSSLVHRMDPNYFSKSDIQKKKKLGDIATITRGNITHKELRENFPAYIHTTNFTDFSITLPTRKTHNKHTLVKGDVIMCRVGKRIVGKTREFLGEEVVFSDCIYRLRFNKVSDKKRFLNFAATKRGENELRRLSKGVCSRYITISELRELCF